MRRLRKQQTSDTRPVVREALRHTVNGELNSFVDAIAALRKRPIRLLGWPLAGDVPSGLWIARTDQDFIVYPEGAPAARKRAIVCHELAHMLLGHNMREDGQSAQLAAMVVAPSIDPAVAARFLTRHGYEDTIEAEAETLGTELAASLAAAEADPTERVARRLR